MMELDQLLLATRVVFYLGIAFMIGIWYKPGPDARPRQGVSTIATLLAGFSFALGTLNLFSLLKLMTGDPWDNVQLATMKELLATGFVGLVFLLTVLARGNVAKLIPKRIWP